MDENKGLLIPTDYIIICIYKKYPTHGKGTCFVSHVGEISSSHFMGEETTP